MTEEVSAGVIEEVSSGVTEEVSSGVTKDEECIVTVTLFHYSPFFVIPAKAGIHSILTNL